MILRDNKVLLGRRHTKVHGGGTWSMPGGKMRIGESFEDVAYRETLEEAGIKINKEKLKVISLTNETDMAPFIVVGMLCEDFEGEPTAASPDEIIDWNWFLLNNLPGNIFRPSERVLKNFFDKEFYKH